MAILKGHKMVPGEQPDVMSHTKLNSLHILAYVELAYRIANLKLLYLANSELRDSLLVVPSKDRIAYCICSS